MSILTQDEYEIHLADFKQHDKDEIGLLEPNEVRGLLTTQLQREATEKEFKTFMRNVDVNVDGKVSFQEYMNRMCGKRWRQSTQRQQYDAEITSKGVSIWWTKTESQGEVWDAEYNTEATGNDTERNATEVPAVQAGKLLGTSYLLSWPPEATEASTEATIVEPTVLRDATAAGVTECPTDSTPPIEVPAVQAGKLPGTSYLLSWPPEATEA